MVPMARETDRDTDAPHTVRLAGSEGRIANVVPPQHLGKSAPAGQPDGRRNGTTSQYGEPGRNTAPTRQLDVIEPAGEERPALLLCLRSSNAASTAIRDGPRATLI